MSEKAIQREQTLFEMLFEKNAILLALTEKNKELEKRVVELEKQVKETKDATQSL